MLKILETLFENEPDVETEKGDFMDVMITLVSKYEYVHFKIDMPLSPIEVETRTFL